jgi:hypothetical protein
VGLAHVLHRVLAPLLSSSTVKLICSISTPTLRFILQEFPSDHELAHHFTLKLISVVLFLVFQVLVAFHLYPCTCSLVYTMRRITCCLATGCGTFVEQKLLLSFYLSGFLVTVRFWT